MNDLKFVIKPNECCIFEFSTVTGDFETDMDIKNIVEKFTDPSELLLDNNNPAWFYNSFLKYNFSLKSMKLMIVYTSNNQIFIPMDPVRKEFGGLSTLIYRYIVQHTIRGNIMNKLSNKLFNDTKTDFISKFLANHIIHENECLVISMNEKFDEKLKPYLIDSDDVKWKGKYNILKNNIEQALSKQFNKNWHNKNLYVNVKVLGKLLMENRYNGKKFNSYELGLLLQKLDSKFEEYKSPYNDSLVTMGKKLFLENEIEYMYSKLILENNRSGMYGQKNIGDFSPESLINFTEDFVKIQKNIAYPESYLEVMSHEYQKNIEDKRFTLYYLDIHHIQKLLKTHFPNEFSALNIFLDYFVKSPILNLMREKSKEGKTLDWFRNYDNVDNLRKESYWAVFFLLNMCDPFAVDNIHCSMNEEIFDSIFSNLYLFIPMEDKKTKLAFESGGVLFITSLFLYPNLAVNDDFISKIFGSTNMKKFKFSPYEIRQMVRIYSKKYFQQNEIKCGANEMQRNIKVVNLVYLYFKKLNLPKFTFDELYQLYDSYHAIERSDQRKFGREKKQRKLIKRTYESTYIDIIQNILKTYHDCCKVIKLGSFRYNDLIRLAMSIKMIRCIENAARVGTTNYWNVLMFSDKDFVSVESCLEYCYSHIDICNYHRSRQKFQYDKFALLITYTGSAYKNPVINDFELIYLITYIQKNGEVYPRQEILLWQGPSTSKTYQYLPKANPRVGYAAALYLSQLHKIYEFVTLKPIHIQKNSFTVSQYDEEVMRLYETSNSSKFHEYKWFYSTENKKYYPVVPIFICKTTGKNNNVLKYIESSTTYTFVNLFGIALIEARPLAANFYKNMYQILLLPETGDLTMELTKDMKFIQCKLKELLDRQHEQTLLTMMNQSKQVFRNNYEDMGPFYRGMYIIQAIASLTITLFDENRDVYEKFSDVQLKKKKGKNGETEVLIHELSDPHQLRKELLEKFKKITLKLKDKSELHNILLDSKLNELESIDQLDDIDADIGADIGADNDSDKSNKRKRKELLGKLSRNKRRKVGT